jgi:hypothetical protein
MIIAREYMWEIKVPLFFREHAKSVPYLYRKQRQLQGIQNHLLTNGWKQHQQLNNTLLKPSYLSLLSRSHPPPSRNGHLLEYELCLYALC